MSETATKCQKTLRNFIGFKKTFPWFILKYYYTPTKTVNTTRALFETFPFTAEVNAAGMNCLKHSTCTIPLCFLTFPAVLVFQKDIRMLELLARHNALEYLGFDDRWALLNEMSLIWGWRSTCSCKKDGVKNQLWQNDINDISSNLPCKNLLPFKMS